NLRCARGLSGRLVIAAPEPPSKPFAADGPGFSAAVHDDIGKCGAGGGLKQVITPHHVVEHVEWSLGRSLAVLCLCVRFCQSIGTGTLRHWLGFNSSSSMRVCFQSLRATLMGSMPACFHQVFSSPARCTAR